METKTIKRTLVAQKRISHRCCLKKFVFEKVRTHRDADGQVESQTPFTQELYLFVNGRTEIWLTEDNFDTLCHLVGMDWEWMDSTPSPSTGSAPVAVAAR